MNRFFELIEHAESVTDVIKAAEEAFGKANLYWMKCGLAAVGACVGLYGLWGLWTLLRTPGGGVSTTGKDTAKKQRSSNTRGGAKQELYTKKNTEDDDKKVASVSTPAAAVPQKTASDLTLLSSPIRSRRVGSNAIQRLLVEPNSTIRGFPQVGVLCTSPCQRYFLVSCRKTGKVYLYPQNEKRVFMDKGKDLQHHYFVAIDRVLLEWYQGQSIGVAKCDVSFAAFNDDGSLFVVGDAATDRLFVMTTDRKSSVHIQHVCRLAARRLVSSLGNACSLTGPSGEYLVVAHHHGEKDATVEVLYLLGGPASNHVATSSSNHFSIGHPLSWTVRGTTVGVSGSFLKEPRVATVAIRTETNFWLNPRVTIGKQLQGNTAKVVAMALVMKGSPEFNTREYLITLLESGRCLIYDISGDERPDVILRGECVDADASMECLVGEQRSLGCGNGGCHSTGVGMTVAVSGERYKERLRIAIWNHRDVHVWCQRSDYDFDNQVPFRLEHAVDIQDAHGGYPISRVSFVQFGEGLVTGGAGDDLHVRLWAIPSL